MPASSLPLPTVRQAVASRFADRPTLRQVLAEGLLRTLHTHFPLVARYRPDLTATQPLHLIIPQDQGPELTPPLVDVLLRCWLRREALELPTLAAADYHLSIAPPRRLYAIPSPADTAPGDVIRVQPMLAAWNALIVGLPEAYRAAQLAYWNDRAGGLSRDLWLQQVLRGNLMLHSADQPLDAEQRACLHDLIAGRWQGFQLQTVKVTLQLNGRTATEVLPDILLTASDDSRRFTLYCRPCGEVRAFASLAEFGQALQLQVRERTDFERLDWTPLTVEGDPFAVQSALMLESLLQDLERLDWTRIENVEALEAVYDLASDPASFFHLDAAAPVTGEALRLPPGVRRASPDDQRAFLAGMIDLTVAQADSVNTPPLEEVLDVRRYAARALRQAMLADHPVDANYYADDVLLTVETFVSDGHALGFPQRVSCEEITLTDWAVRRLGALNGGTVTGLRHRTGQLLMDWMTVAYLRELVARVDVGGRYPAYVVATLQNPLERPARLASFARRWRIGLLFDALQAKAAGRLNEDTLQVLARFCRGGGDEGVSIGPVDLRRSPTSARLDRVQGMYLIHVDAPSAWLLYRPLYPQAALHAYPDLDALVAAMGEPGELQASVLDWLDPYVVSIYADGGLREPHLPHWNLDPYARLRRPEAVQLDTHAWCTDLDAQLYDARLQLMLTLGDLQSMSTREVRWTLLTAFSWELLNMALPVVSGAVAMVGWVYADLRSLLDDTEALSTGTRAEGFAAALDILLNTLTVMMHMGAPATQVPTRPAAPRRVALRPLGLPWTDASGSRLPVPNQTPTLDLADPAFTETLLLDFSWRGAERFDGLSDAQRTRLRAMAQPISLAGQRPMAGGAHQGVYRVAGKDYVALGQAVYAVHLDDVGVRIVGTDGEQGPWLRFEQQRWRLDVGLRGGGGRGQRGLNARLQRTRQLHDAIVANGGRLAELNARYLEQTEALYATLLEVQRIDGLRQHVALPDPEQRAKLEASYTQRLTTLETQSNDQRAQRLPVLEALLDVYREVERDWDALRDDVIYQRSVKDADNPTERLGHARRDIATYASVLIEERLSQGHYHRYDAAVRRLLAAPPEHTQGPYQQYRAVLAEIVEIQPAIITASADLDRLLVILPLDQQVKLPYAELSLAQLIERRRTTTVALRHFQALNLAELCLNFNRRAGFSRYRLFNEQLANPRLCLAANTHALLQSAEVTLAERLEILQTAWDEYLAAVLNSDRIRNLGIAQVDASQLDGYRTQMIALKSMAGDEMVAAMRAEAAGGDLNAGRRAYARRPLQVARNHTGQIVLGEVVEEDGAPQLQVPNVFSSLPLHRFQREGDTWTEILPEAVAGEGPLDPQQAQQTSSLAEALLARNDAVQAQARALATEQSDDRSVCSLIDGQIDDLLAVRRDWVDAEGDATLTDRLDAAIDQLRETRELSLTQLYRDTHYPTAAGLAFLHRLGLVKVRYSGKRRRLKSDYLDEYFVDVYERVGGKAHTTPWVAHFHYAGAQDSPVDFIKGHLKRWNQRKMGYADQVAAAEAGQVLNIYRGNLTYAQVRDIVPF